MAAAANYYSVNMALAGAADYKYSIAAGLAVVMSASLVGVVDFFPAKLKKWAGLEALVGFSAGTIAAYLTLSQAGAFVSVGRLESVAASLACGAATGGATWIYDMLAKGM